jgi:hypothetical protein
VSQTITTPEQVRAIFAQVRAELDGEERAGTSPAPEPSTTPAPDPESPQAAAEAALKAKQDHEALVTASRALLEETLPALGYDIGDGLVDRMDAADVLKLAGTAQQEQEDKFELPERSEKEQELASLQERYWNLAPYQRAEQAAEIGVDFTKLDAEMRERDLT